MRVSAAQITSLYGTLYGSWGASETTGSQLDSLDVKKDRLPGPAWAFALKLLHFFWGKSPVSLIAKGLEG